jgi:hypothetical protein
LKCTLLAVGIALLISYVETSWNFTPSSAVVLIWLMKTIVAFIVGLMIATAAWAQIDKASGIVSLPSGIGTLDGAGYHKASYQMGLRHDGVVVWRWSPYH